MCGLCGVFVTGDVPEASGPLRDVRHLTALMTRRGPDDEGYWGDGRCTFGFRRLAIIDLSPAAHQPMVSARGSVLVFNGELYNYREIRQELESEGIRFRSQSDTEVVLEALDRWRLGALGRFNGMFAFAYYEAQDVRLTLARDPMGVKPLYYLRGPAGVVFASQYDQILNHPWCDRNLDAAVLHLYLRLGTIPPPYGLFRGTHQVLPGHAIWFDGTGRRGQEQYFRFSTDGATLRPEEAVDATVAAVRNAVRRQRVSDVPLGGFLSGGVDSPLVLAALRDVSGGAVPAVTIAAEDPRLDESPAATAYARRLDVHHHVAAITARDALDCLDELSAAYSEPFADDSAFPTFLLSRVARDHMTVALSGDGGDELFWGYPRFDKVHRARPYFRYPRPLRTAIYAGARLVGRTWPPRGIRSRDIGSWYLDSHAGLQLNDLMALWPDAAGPPEDFDCYRLDTVPDPGALGEWMREVEIRAHLPGLLLKVDRASMYFGLEAPVPDIFPEP